GGGGGSFASESRRLPGEGLSCSETRRCPTPEAKLGDGPLWRKRAVWARPKGRERPRTTPAVRRSAGRRASGTKPGRASLPSCLVTTGCHGATAGPAGERVFSVGPRT
ncbi:hypothetical protein LX36DRAFT_751899, partial [Colletotrichum falcatum]